MAKLIQKSVNPTAILSTPHQTWKERVMKKLLSFPLLASMITSLFLMANKVMAQTSEVWVWAGARVPQYFTIYQRISSLLFFVGFFLYFVLMLFRRVSWKWLATILGLFFIFDGYGYFLDYSNYFSTRTEYLIRLSFLLQIILVVTLIAALFKKISWRWPVMFFFLGVFYAISWEVYVYFKDYDLLFIFALSLLYSVFVLALFQKIRWRWLGIVFVIFLLFVGASLLGL